MAHTFGIPAPFASFGADEVVPAAACIVFLERRWAPAWCPHCGRPAWYASMPGWGTDTRAFCLPCDRWAYQCRCRECREEQRLRPPSAVLTQPWLLRGEGSDGVPGSIERLWEARRQP